MKNNALAILTLLSLGLVSGMTSAQGAPTPDLALNEHELAFGWTTPEEPDLFVVKLTPNTKYNPLIIPCNANWISGNLIMEYNSEGPTVYPRMVESFYNENGTPLVTHGYSGAPLSNSFTLWAPAQSPHQPITEGYFMFDAVSQVRNIIPQPSDLPADQLVRIHLALTGYTDNTATTAYADANPADNVRDFWFKRQCSCQ